MHGFTLCTEVLLIKAAIFDVDGTLVDSNLLHVEAWREAFGHYGKALSAEEVHAQIGKGGDQLMPVFLSRHELDRFGEELERLRVELFSRDYLGSVEPFPKVRELFERLKGDGVLIALASSAKEQELSHHLDTETTGGQKPAKRGNHRNGTSAKTVITPDGALPLNILEVKMDRWIEQAVR